MPMGQMRKTIQLDVTINQKLWPYRVINEVQKVMEEGLAKYPAGGWENKSVEFHLDRAQAHLAQINQSDNEDHLTHAFTRLMMAVAIRQGYTTSHHAEGESND